MLFKGREIPTPDPSMLREPNRLSRCVSFVRATGRHAWASAALVLSACSCADTDSPAPAPPPPDPSTMEVVVLPSEVTLPAGWSGKFSVQVLARDPEGNVYFQLPASGPNGELDAGDVVVSWDPWDAVPSGVSLDGAPGWRTRLKVAAATSSVTLQARIDGVPVPGTLTLRRFDATSPSGDQVLAEHVDGDLVEILLAGGGGGTGDCVDEAYGFVGHLAIQNLAPPNAQGGPCRNEAVLFSSSHAAKRWGDAWHASSDQLGGAAAGTGQLTTSGSSGAPSPAPGDPLRSLPLAAYLLCQPSAPCSPDQFGEWASLMQNQVDYANQSFALNRVGVEVSYAPLTTLSDNSDAKGCATAPAVLSAAQSPKAGQVVVLLIRGAIMGSRRAEMCGEFYGIEPSKGFIIMDPSQTWDSAVLAHELGHVLGLKEPDWGHVSLLSDIGHDNIMAEELKWVARFRFTLGQAHRMNFATNGLLTAAGLQSSSVACGCDPRPRGPCPPLSRDLKPLASGGSWGGTCLPY